MTHNIHYAQQARRDLDDIWDYIAEELQNADAAGRMINRIMDAVDRLADYPEMGAPLSSVVDARSDYYRFLVTGQYLTFYRVCGGDVYVDRILYGRRDYLRLLFEGAETGNAEE